MHSDSKKRRSFVALLVAAGDVRRYKVASERPLLLDFTGAFWSMSFLLLTLWYL